MLHAIWYFTHENLTISVKHRDDDYFNNKDRHILLINQDKTTLNILSNIVKMMWKVKSKFINYNKY